MKKQTKQLDLTITIPARFTPLFRAHCALAGQSAPKLAARAVLRWLGSEDAMERIEEQVNAVLKEA